MVWWEGGGVSAGCDSVVGGWGGCAVLCALNKVLPLFMSL